MDKLDWKYDKDHIIFLGIIYAVAGSALTIIVGYLLHVGWALYGA